MNKGPSRNMNWALSKHNIEKLKIHASETAWIGGKFDAVLDNNGSLDDLYLQIEQILVKNQEPDLPAATLDPREQLQIGS
jgi:hypothetical protein